MRLQSLIRLIAIGSMVAVGLMLSAINLDARSAQAQAAATATPRSDSAPSAGAPGTGAPITYTVKSGDSFNAIASQFNLTPQQLQALNGITNTGVIRAGQVLIVSVSTLVPTPTAVIADTLTPTPTAAATQTPAPLPTESPTIQPTAAPAGAPTGAPTDLPVATLAPRSIKPPAVASAPAATTIPIDVILVGGVMVLAIIGIIIGFRTQRG